MGKKTQTSNNKKQRKNQTGLKSSNHKYFKLGCCCGWKCTSKDPRQKQILWRLHNKMCKVEKSKNYAGIIYTRTRELNAVDKITSKILGCNLKK